MLVTYSCRGDHPNQSPPKPPTSAKVHAGGALVLLGGETSRECWHGPQSKTLGEKRFSTYVRLQDLRIRGKGSGPGL